MLSLPIDPLLPAIADSLNSHRNLVLTAEPGAGKTTRVPPYLLATVKGEIWVLEPRRLAARLSAMRVAEELGERLGEQVGYQVRFEEVAGPKTRLRYLTEGVILRRLLQEPALPRVGLVVLDEFHERSLQIDLALALLRRLQAGARPDLRLLAMSATLDAGPLCAFLDDAPLISAPGRLFAVELEHERQADPRPLETKVASAVRRVLTESEGDVLVFLPGAAEIRRCAEACALLAGDGLSVLPLHGSLPPEAQDRAVRPSPGRKVILSTNVAETSLTIEGVRVVIDSGLARHAGHSPWSGLPSLKVGKVSQASCTQRAGRAGRTAPGRCLRLFTKLDHDSRPLFTAPEVRSADLSEPLLTLRALGVTDPRSFGWLEAPDAAALSAGEDLLRLLGATDSTCLTDLGQRMARLPLHPRLSRLLLEAAAHGLAEQGTALAAVLSEHDGRGADGADHSGDSDPLEQVERIGRSEPARRAQRQLRRLIDSPSPPPPGDSPPPRSGGGQGGGSTSSFSPRGEQGRVGGPRDRSTQRQAFAHEQLLRALLLAFPDRVAQRRRPRGRELLLSQGGTGTLSPRSVVKEAEWMLAVDGEEQRKSGQSALGTVFSASAIDKEWLLELLPDQVRAVSSVAFNAEAERVDAMERLVYGPAALVLEESRGGGDSAEVAQVLAGAAMDRGPEAFAPEGELRRFLGRLDHVRQAHPEGTLPAIDVQQGLRELAQGRRSFAEMQEHSLVETLLGQLTPAQQALLARAAPSAVALASGRRATVEYEPGKPPWIAARLADFFGLADGPRIDEGRTPLTLHLLAPNGRAVQVTNDLRGFWERTYPAVRRELSRRYPRHPWPEDPRVSVQRKSR